MRYDDLWDVAFHPAFEDELFSLSEGVQDALFEVIELLKAAGPQLRRPHSDTLKGSKHVNMKELRFDADGGVWRIAYAFDPERKAILLVGADKSGVSEKRFYRSLISKADARLDEHLASLREQRKNMKKEYRVIPAEEVLAKLPPERQARIKARGAELIAEYFALQDLRRAKKLTQEEIAARLGGRQVYVSRLERRADMKLSTLQDYVNALGGELQLMVTFPQGDTVRLGRFGEQKKPTPTKRKRQAAKT